MFIPCNEKGEPLEEPTDMYTNDQYCGAAMDEYQKAKEKVIFEGFGKLEKANGWMHIMRHESGRNLYMSDNHKSFHTAIGGEAKKTIEDLTGLGLKYKGI